MKKIVLSLTTAAALSSFAMAGGDIAPVVPAPADSWSGFYVGAQVGGTWGDADTTFYDRREDNRWKKYDISKSNPNGFLGGVYAGYNWLFDNNWLIGMEGSYNWSNAKDDGAIIRDGIVIPVHEFEVRQKWEAAIIARVGKVIDDSYMPYILGGATWTKLNGIIKFETGDEDTSGSVKKDDTIAGWTIGAGVEFKLTESLHARAQYRYNNYQDADFSGYFYDLIKAKTDYNAHMLQVGISYRF